MFHFERFEAFGWTIHRKQLQEGESFDVVVPQGYNPKTASDITLWVSGRVQSDLTGRVLEVGDCSATSERSPGTHRMTALEQSEFWCINHKINRKRRPVVDVVDATTSRRLNFNTIICSGQFRIDDQTYTAPAAVSAGKTIEPIGRVLGLAFKGEK